MRPPLKAVFMWFAYVLLCYFEANLHTKRKGHQVKVCIKQSPHFQCVKCKKTCMYLNFKFCAVRSLFLDSHIHDGIILFF